MNEKRYFKIFCKRHILGGQNKYVLLFDFIDKSESYDTILIRELLKNNGFSDDFISSDMNYLNKMLLKSLNDFHSEKTSDIKIKQQLISIEILFYKGLYDECLKLIGKVKRMKMLGENQYLILELLNWEKKCTGYSKGLLKAIEVNNSLDGYYENLKVIKEITNCYYKSYFYKNSVGKLQIEKITTDFEALFRSFIFEKQPVFETLQSEIFYYLIYANYYHVLRNKIEEIKYLEHVITVYEDNQDYKNENPLDYISVYTRFIDLKKKSESIEFYSYLEKLRSFDKMIDLQKNVAKERVFLFSSQAELEHLLAVNKYEGVLETMKHIQDTIAASKYNIEPYYQMSLYYLFASIYCSIGNFSTGLKFVNKVLNEFKFADRPNTFIKTEFLNIVIHYELKNYKLVLKNITTLEKKYNKTFKLNYLEKQILKNIQKIAENPFIANERVEFSKLYKKLDVTILEEEGVLNSNYIKYIESKTKK